MSKKNSKQKSKPLNFVAKFLNEFNKPSVEVDRKKKTKKGNRKGKHKWMYGKGRQDD